MFPGVAAWTAKISSDQELARRRQNALAHLRRAQPTGEAASAAITRSRSDSDGAEQPGWLATLTGSSVAAVAPSADAEEAPAAGAPSYASQYSFAHRGMVPSGGSFRGGTYPGLPSYMKHAPMVHDTWPREGPKVPQKISFSPAYRSMLRVADRKLVDLKERVPWYIIHPNSGLRLWWDLVMTAIIFYIALVEPFRIAFEFDSTDQSLVRGVGAALAGPPLKHCPATAARRSSGEATSHTFFVSLEKGASLVGITDSPPFIPPLPLPPLFWRPRLSIASPQLSIRLTSFDSAISVYFAIDIILNFFTAYTNEVGRLVVSFPAITRSYLSFWFVVDFLSTFPFDIFVDWVSHASLTDSPGLTSQLRLIRLLRLLRLARITRLARIFQRLEAPLEKMGMAEATRSLSIIMIIVLTAHWVACLFWLVTSVEGDFESAWSGYFATRKLLDAPTENIYTVALYWSIMTLGTIGYGAHTQRRSGCNGCNGYPVSTAVGQAPRLAVSASPACGAKGLLVLWVGANA